MHVTDGGLIGKALDCRSRRSGFESPPSDTYFLFFIEGARDWLQIG